MADQASPSPFTIPEPQWKFADGPGAQPEDPKRVTMKLLVENLIRFAAMYSDMTAAIEREQPVLKPSAFGGRDANAAHWQKQFQSIIGIDRVRQQALMRYGDELTIETARRLLGELLKIGSVRTLEQAEQLMVDEAAERLEQHVLGNRTIPAAVRNWLIARYLSDPTPGDWKRTADAPAEPIVCVRFEEFAELLVSKGIELPRYLDDWKSAGWIEDIWVDISGESLPNWLKRLKLPNGRHRLVGILKTVLNAPVGDEVKENRIKGGATSKLPAIIQKLLTEATRAYAEERSSVWLFAFPSEMRMNRCGSPTEAGPKLGEILDGVVHLPMQCFSPLGEVNLGKSGASVRLLVESPNGDAMNRFVDFARRAGAALVAYRPPWESSNGSTDAATVWAAALMFTSPNARRGSAGWDNKCRMLKEPWAESCAALRDWNSVLPGVDQNPTIVINEARAKGPRQQTSPEGYLQAETMRRDENPNPYDRLEILRKLASQLDGPCQEFLDCEENLAKALRPCLQWLAVEETRVQWSNAIRETGLALSRIDLNQQPASIRDCGRWDGRTSDYRRAAWAVCELLDSAANGDSNRFDQRIAQLFSDADGLSRVPEILREVLGRLQHLYRKQIKGHFLNQIRNASAGSSATLDVLRDEGVLSNIAILAVSILEDPDFTQLPTLDSVKPIAFTNRLREFDGWEIVRDATQEELSQFPPPASGRFVIAKEPPTLDGVAELQGKTLYVERHEHLMLTWKNLSGLEVLHQTDGLLTNGHNDATWLPAGWEMDVCPVGWDLLHLKRWFELALGMARITERPDLPNVSEDQLCSIMGPSYAPTPRGLVHHAFLIVRHLAFPNSPKEPTAQIDWAGCIAALRQNLDFLEQAMKAKELTASPGTVDDLRPGASQNAKETRKEPTANALKAYRVLLVTGKTQTEIAEIMSTELGRPIRQGQVSRWIKTTTDWIKAGNVLPDLGESLHKQPDAVDPEILEMGARRDGRTKRQRAIRSDDDDE